MEPTVAQCRRALAAGKFDQFLEGGGSFWETDSVRMITVSHHDGVFTMSRYYLVRDKLRTWTARSTDEEWKEVL